MTTHGRIANMPKLSSDDLSDAGFRARDRAWSALADLFDQLQEEEHLTYEELGNRIGKKKSQVHKWLASPCNVTLQSLGLLAEGMNAELYIQLLRRLEHGNNEFHECESAALRNKFENFVFEYQQRDTPRETRVNKPSSFDILVDQVG
jgi:transcriptional regulator with XRE-family HTH domain